jgi:hypothetical protein
MRHLVWALALAIFLVPAAAMQLTNKMKWDAIDFVIFGGMLALACIAFEGVAAATSNFRYRALGGLAIVAALCSSGLSSPSESLALAKRDRDAGIRSAAVRAISLA